MIGPVSSMKPGSAWLLLFLPALSYYVTTRLHSMGLFRSSTYGTVVDTVVSGFDCGTDHPLLFLTNDCSQLRYPIYLVEEEFDGIVATAWKHDEELGRGYLLLSTSRGRGKVWQWETGGGPIAIGRTLHLQDSGCRSGLYRNCSVGECGSGGIVVDTWHEPPRLVVSEWGEGRIARLEENGARTPLVIKVPVGVDIAQNESISAYTSSRRVQTPSKLLFSPLGDLMILDTCGEKDCLFRLPKAATSIPPLESLSASRKAHSWESNDMAQVPQLLMQSPHLGGIALEPNQWLRMYVTMKQNGVIVVVKLSVEDDGDENNDQQPRQSTIVLDYSLHTSEPRAVEVDQQGNLYLVVDGGVLMATPSGEILGKITISEDQIVDLKLGEDKFLYMATNTKLMRMRIKHMPLAIPTDLLLKT